MDRIFEGFEDRDSAEVLGVALKADRKWMRAKRASLLTAMAFAILMMAVYAQSILSPDLASWIEAGFDQGQSERLQSAVMVSQLGGALLGMAGGLLAQTVAFRTLARGFIREELEELEEVERWA